MQPSDITPVQSGSPAPTSPDQGNPPALTPTPELPSQDDTGLFGQIVERIIEQQETIIGPIAVEQAKQIKELTIDWPQHHVSVSGNPQKAIDDLVQKYRELFGQIAVQVSRDASASYLAQLPLDQHPKSLTA